MRNIASFASMPCRSAFRTVGRALKHLSESFCKGWSIGDLSNAPENLAQRISDVRPRPLGAGKPCVFTIDLTLYCLHKKWMGVLGCDWESGGVQGTEGLKQLGPEHLSLMLSLHQRRLQRLRELSGFAIAELGWLCFGRLVFACLAGAGEQPHVARAGRPLT